MKEIKINFP